MILKYKIFPEKNLLVDFLSGHIKYDDLKMFHLAERKDPQMHLVNRVISNIAGSEFDFSITEMDEYITILKETARNTDIKWAILTKTPYQTVLSTLIMNDVFFKNKVEIFSTTNAIANFLKLPFKDEDFYTDDYNIITLT